VRLAAWTVQRAQDGAIKVTIRDLRDSSGLQDTLRAAGVPASVQLLRHDFTGTTSPGAIPRGCQAPPLSDAANARLQEKIMPVTIPVPGRNSVVIVIHPAAIPAGIGLFIKAFAASPGTHAGTTFSLQTDLVTTSPQCTGS
jgi:hypothetical protein